MPNIAVVHKTGKIRTVMYMLSLSKQYSITNLSRAIMRELFDSTDNTKSVRIFLKIPNQNQLLS